MTPPEPIAITASDLFGVTHHDKMMEAQRELDMRRRVYPRRVAEQKMTEAAASRQLAVMQAIVDDYALIAATDADVIQCRPKGIGTRGDGAQVLTIHVDVARLNAGPRRVDVKMPLNGYVATEMARALIRYCSRHAGENWGRVVAAVREGQELRAEA